MRRRAGFSVQPTFRRSSNARSPFAPQLTMLFDEPRRVPPLMIVAGVAALVLLAVAVKAVFFSAAPPEEAAPAAEEIPADQAVVEEEPAETFPPSPYDMSAIEEVLQNPGYPSGCELASLTSVLGALGYDATLDEIVNGGYVAYDAGWTGSSSEYYFGSPYSEGGGFPPAIVVAANRYLDAQDAAAQARDITGTTCDELVDLANRGYPSLLWVTVSYDYPIFSGAMYEEYTWYMNEHCVVFYGCEGDEAKLMDPLVGLTVMSADALFDVYETCGSMAVVID